MKKQLTKREIYNLLPNSTLRIIADELRQYLGALKPATEANLIHKTSDEIFLIENAIRLKNGGNKL